MSDSEPTSPPSPSLVVHHLNDSRSQRILWLLEELQLPYTIKKYTRTPEQRAPNELLQIHPLGKSPVITDGDGDGDGEVVLAESGAIVEYIIQKYAKKDEQLQPSDGSAYLDNLYFTHYAEGSLMPILVQKIIFNIIPQRSPFLIRPLVNLIFGQLDKQLVQPAVTQHLQFIESHLSKNPSDFFTSTTHLTSSDYMMLFPLEAILSQNPALLGPKSIAYVRRMQERPAYKRGIEKGGEYSYSK